MQVEDNSDHESGLLAAGTVIGGHYVVQKCLGSGAAGTVYLCVDKRLGSSKVAVKTFSQQILSDSLMISRIQRELLSLNAIEHDNVTRFYEVFNVGGVVGYSMEYVPGKTLAQLIDGSDKLDFFTITTILTSLFKGLKAIHEAGLVHRDLKPANVIIDEGGTSKITDFGLARLLDDNYDAQDSMGSLFDKESHAHFNVKQRTEHGAIVGTLEYISPEYAALGKLDFRSDIYAMGIIAYEMVTKRFPYSGVNDIEVLEAKISKNAPDVRYLREDTPEDLAHFISRCLVRDPRSRFQTCSDALDALVPLLTELRSSSSAGYLREDLDPKLLESMRGGFFSSVVDFLVRNSLRLLFLSVVMFFSYYYRFDLLDFIADTFNLRNPYPGFYNPGKFYLR
jgi:serine/threonine protein kinase